MERWAVPLALVLLVHAAVAQTPAASSPVVLLDGDRLGGHAEAFDAYGHAWADLDGDGLPEVTLLNDNARTYVIDVAQQRLEAEMPTRHPGGTTSWHTSTLNGASAGDLDGDERADLVVLNSGGMLSRFEAAANGTGLVLQWELLLHAPSRDPGFLAHHPWRSAIAPENETHLAHGHPTLAYPSKGARQQWIFAQSDGMPGQFAIRPDGTIAWMDLTHDGHAGPIVVDGPRTRLAVFATDAGLVLARDAATGDQVWSFSALDHGVVPGSFSVAPAAVDVDGDGATELFVAARQAVDDGTFGWAGRQHAKAFLLDIKGAVLWTGDLPLPMVHSRAVAVPTPDGADLLVLGWNTIGHKPGAWERLGPGILARLDGASGAIEWTAPVDAPATDFDVPLATWNGTLVTVVPDRDGVSAGLAIVDVGSGRRLAFAPLPAGWEPTRGASLGDADGDGMLEAVQAVARPGLACIPKDDTPCREGALALWHTPLPASGLLDSAGSPHADAPRPNVEHGVWRTVWTVTVFVLVALVVLAALAEGRAALRRKWTPPPSQGPDQSK